VITFVSIVNKPGKILPRPRSPLGGSNWRFCSPQPDTVRRGFGASALYGVFVDCPAVMSVVPISTEL